MKMGITETGITDVGTRDAGTREFSVKFFVVGEICRRWNFPSVKFIVGEMGLDEMSRLQQPAEKFRQIATPRKIPLLKRNLWNFGDVLLRFSTILLLGNFKDGSRFVHMIVTLFRFL
jgi:hypothetical protein